MPIVLAKCTECGGTIKVDSEKKLGVCENCGEPFVVEEAINNFTNYYTTNYITNNNTTHNYGEGSVVNIYEKQNKDFEIEGGVLKAYHGEALNVVVPDGVVEIGEYSFKGLAISNVILPNSVKRIGCYAFENCMYLKTIEIPSEVDIEIGAFLNCSSLILSELLEKKASDNPLIMNDRLLVNHIYTGIVTRICSFGVFVKVCNTIEGLVHISRISNPIPNNIEDIVKIGDTVKVKCINITDENKVDFSMKDA